MENTLRKPVDSSIEKPLILIVDDEALICSTLSGVLEDEGYQTVHAGDGQEALQRVAQYHPPLVFLDIWMPGADGVEVLERIKELSPFSEVIMISGHANVSNALEASKRGAFDFIEKPLDLGSIILSAERALERREARLREFGLNFSSAEELAGDPVPKTPTTRRALLSHAGVTSRGLAGKNLGQRTIKRGAILYGHCLHSGQKSGLVFEPLPLNSGIHFGKIGDSKTVPAFVEYVGSTSFATTVRSGQTSAATIEHLMSALHANKITNLLVKCNGEVPIFDGSALEFCNLLERVGVEEQGGEWFEIAVDESYHFNPSENERIDGLEGITIEPSEAFTLRYELSYPEPVGEQVFEFTLNTPDDFKREIAPARTFGFMKDIDRLQRAGLAAGGRLNNFILIGDDKVINTELRFPEELARHKILDAIGDLYLLGRPLVGKITAKMTGHSDNAKVLAKLKEKIITEKITT